MKKTPQMGGCWFCFDDEPNGLVMDREFDTMVHLSCINKVLKEDPEHPEAQLMAYLLEPVDEGDFDA